MDIVACATVAVVASQAISTGKLSSTLQLCVVFLATYVAVKAYRIFLYHKLFSPLRHIPGPKVSCGSHLVSGDFVGGIC